MAGGSAKKATKQAKDAAAKYAPIIAGVNVAHVLGVVLLRVSQFVRLGSRSPAQLRAPSPVSVVDEEAPLPGAADDCRRCCCAASDSPRLAATPSQAAACAASVCACMRNANAGTSLVAVRRLWPSVRGRGRAAAHLDGLRDDGWLFSIGRMRLLAQLPVELRQQRIVHHYATGLGHVVGDKLLDRVVLRLPDDRRRRVRGHDGAGRRLGIAEHGHVVVLG